MPIISEQKRNKGLQYHINLKPGDVGEYVLLPGDPARVELFANFVDNPQKMAYTREFQTYTGYFKGIKVSCTSTGIGCPSTAIAVEELANIGASTFIRIGSCGGLADGVNVGDLIIATGSMRNEGTTPFYAPLAFPAVADFYLTQALVQSADELKSRSRFTYHVGLCSSGDAFYGGTPEFTVKMHDLGLKAVEMESAAIFIITQIRGLRGAGIFTVTATNFMGESIEEVKANEDLPNLFTNMILVALEAVYKIHNHQ